MHSYIYKDREAGFTLVELLVVIIVIGILAAIAIPVFLNQRHRAWEAEAKQDLVGIRTQVFDLEAGGASLTSHETWLTAFRQAGVWGSVDKSGAHDIAGKTYAICANPETFTVTATNGAIGPPSTNLHHIAAHGGVQRTIIDPAATGNTLTKICQSIMPDYTYAEWAHGRILQYEQGTIPG